MISGNRVVWIDYAKAFAIVLIVASHIQHQLLKMGLCAATDAYEFFDAVLYSFHVPLFFFLSGLFFCSSLAKRGLKGFALEKLRTIYYPFAIWSILQTVVEVIFSHATAEPIALREIITSLYYPRAHFWFLYALFFMSILSALIFCLCRRAPRILLSFVVLALFFSAIYVDYGPFADMARNYIFFAAGILAGTIGFVNKTHWFRGWVALAGMIAQFAILQYVFVEQGWNTAWFGRIVLAASGGVFVIALSVAVSDRNVRWLRYLGKKTLPIYVAHILAAYPIMVVLQKLTGATGFVLYAAVGMLAGIGIPIVMEALARKLNLGFVFEYPSSARN